ncbi:type II toxin-antitoxin system VapC family toxin [Branchiibius sp. NY16-3462-2]|uniref:type II toxin-antitoxin system VapC family toxin n=1 Tax=Branchiibius sp. NY16-3462-2 TaxID=1807500 RepID=UPI00079818E9|nr:type II toxin-antitoxin system VapC family toxin [Branchiibius sp. NY16-3462-2]KYH45312.1 hypothetical protein AZH51_05405 [Branchiibius sp. NY16-3462-2]
MSGLLLDTHVLLWLLTDHHSLGPQTRARITGEVVSVSAVSLWEIEIKRSTGKLTLSGDAQSGLAQAIAESGVRELPLRWDHLSTYSNVQLPQRDPFDRLLLAQASSERLDFVTADRQILGVDIGGVYDARD